MQRGKGKSNQIPLKQFCGRRPKYFVDASSSSSWLSLTWKLGISKRSNHIMLRPKDFQVASVGSTTSVTKSPPNTWLPLKYVKACWLFSLWHLRSFNNYMGSEGKLSFRTSREGQLASTCFRLHTNIGQIPRPKRQRQRQRFKISQFHLAILGLYIHIDGRNPAPIDR